MFNCHSYFILLLFNSCQSDNWICIWQFVKALYLTEDWQCLNASWQPCNRGNLQQSYSYDLLFPLNHVQPQPEPGGHERCVRRVRQVPMFRSPLTQWQSGRRVVVADAQRRRDGGSRVLFGTAVACSDNPQSNLTNWKEYTHSLFSLIRQQTAPESLLQTSQMNELDSVNSGCRGQIFSDECCTNAKLKWIRWEIGCQRCCISRIFCSKYLPNSLHLFWCLIGFDREVYAVCSQQFTVVSWYTDGIVFSWPQVGKNVDGINYTTRCALSVYHVQHGTNQAIRNHCISEALFIQS